MYKFTIHLRNVPTNAAYATRRGVWYMTKRAKTFKDKATQVIREQYTGEKPIDGLVKVKIDLLFKSEKASDVDSVKLIIDCLNDLVITDDANIRVLKIYKHINRGVDATQIEVEEI